MVEHNRAGFAQAVAHLRQRCAAHQIGDLIVAVERTGRYHQPLQRSFAEAGYEVRIVHPFTTKHHRLPADPGNKTDDTDPLAIHRAAVNGFALVQRPLPLFWQELQLLVRHRRDLVEKTSRLRCQIREHLESALPGYAACFSTLWEHAAALQLAWDLGTPQAMLTQGVAGMGHVLQARKIRFQKRTLEQVLSWAGAAASSAQAAASHRRVAAALDQDRREKQGQITALELEIASRLIRSDYLRLLQLPGINVISAAEFAAEMGPIANYASSRNIIGRAGLYPSRYQSDQVDLHARRA